MVAITFCEISIRLLVISVNRLTYILPYADCTNLRPHFWMICWIYIKKKGVDILMRGV